ncbi:hypothetical protein BD309DRAFT_874152 [Dichomitus squalens]|uniref:Uncharacterized protein n=1 Tax=Dichomitus squalens TaxID=114155 RepID=A0A4Q9NE53_9APHY|nr:uncharacterized protein DICSQDRAFT_133546 [Dichomitus squalens LYAD-421 SS1]EJF64836.1 hypothetical protein DICSQDRAFT_133546 [Dichomitus squalens LYAD-421 SS1]TBU33428.1 hypothetical protein BD311DRAFT_748569 [Dichomitus squalens]TBU38547.1 hypothetical protein BD309DRAFT_874152 [Dichomitus squalens]TBU62820.1 hypothetical protein BD310DRAFT_810107 [Dichomitus squalens]
MSSNENNVPRSLPIPIGRGRSGSDSDSSSDSGSVSPVSPVQTPASGALPRIAPISPSTSPILSYFLSNQPPKSPPNATFPFRRGMTGPPLYEEDEVSEADQPIQRHGRRASAAAWPGHDRFPPVAPVPNDKQERAAGLLRRLSLGGNMTKPPILPVPRPPNGTTQPSRSKTPPTLNSNSTGAPSTPMRKARRSNTMAAGTSRPPRAPSPMGERILKGHFDGFN